MKIILSNSIEDLFKFSISSDKRSPLLSQEQLEESKTHDDLWNAAQLQLVRKGKMHGFLR